jgi:hypothetical protein
MYNQLIQKGGNQPDIKLLKNISLFEHNSIEESYLNPTWGYIWLNTGILVNYKLLTILDDINLNNFIKKFINIIDINEGSIITTENPKPTSLIKDDLLPNKLIGRYLALKYIMISPKFKFSNEIINLIDLTNKLKSTKIKKIFKDRSNIRTFFTLNDDIKYILSKDYPIVDYNNFEDNWQIIGTDTQNIILNRLEELKLKKSDKINTYLNNLHKKLYEYKFIDSIESKYNIKALEKEIKKYLNDINTKISLLKNYKHPKNATFKPFKEFEKRWIDNEDERYFYVILAIMWFNSTSKNDIKEYYDGLIEYEIKVNIPEDWSVWINSKFTKELDLESAIHDSRGEIQSLDEPYPFNQLLAIYNINYKTAFTIIDYKYANLSDKVEYSDCGASSLRDFIRILILNKSNNYNLDLLSALGAKLYIIKFFEVFDEKYQKLEGESGNLDITSIKHLLKNDGVDNVDIFLKSDFNNSRNVWGFITSNLRNVSYHKSYLELGEMFEIKSGGNHTGDLNILNVIKELFSNVNVWGDFEEIISSNGDEYNYITLEENIENNYGYIEITKENGVFKYNIVNNHFYISFESLKSINVNYESLIEQKKLSKEQVFYLKMLTFDIENINLLYYPSNIYFFKFNDSLSLITLFNKYYYNTDYYKDIISKDDYNTLFTTIKYFNTDELLRTRCDLFNLNEKNIFGSKYANDEGIIEFNNIILNIDPPDECDCSQINLADCNICYFKLNDIISIKFKSIQNNRLNDSLKIFENINELSFPNEFNNGYTPLDNNLNLNELETLEYYAPIESIEDINSISQIPKLIDVTLNTTKELGEIIERNNINVMYYLNKNIVTDNGITTTITGKDNIIFDDLVNDNNNMSDNKYIFYNNTEHLIIDIKADYEYYTYYASNITKALKFKQFIKNLKKLKKITVENFVLHHVTQDYLDDFEKKIISLYNELPNLNELLIKNIKLTNNRENYEPKYFIKNRDDAYKSKYYKYSSSNSTSDKDYINDSKNHQIDYDFNRNYKYLYNKYSSSNSTSDKDYINDSKNHQIDYDFNRNYKYLYNITDSKNHQSDIFYKKYCKYKMKYLNLKKIKYEFY